MLHICPENVQEDMRLKGYEEPEKTYEQVLHRLEELINMHGGTGKSSGINSFEGKGSECNPCGEAGWDGYWGGCHNQDCNDQSREILKINR